MRQLLDDQNDICLLYHIDQLKVNGHDYELIILFHLNQLQSVSLDMIDKNSQNLLHIHLQKMGSVFYQ